MATQEMTLNRGWNLVSGPGAFTGTVERIAGQQYSASGGKLGFAESLTEPTHLSNGKGHDIEGKTFPLNVSDGENLWIWSPGIYLLTYTRAAAPI